MLGHMLSSAAMRLLPRLHYATVTESTNDDCWAGKGDICCAQRQKHGRGRYGRKWDDHQNEQLFISWRLQHQETIFTLPMIVSLSVCKALEQKLGLNGVQIKWPNDLYYQQAKLGGCLVELRTINNVRNYVCGLGVNISPMHSGRRTVDYQYASVNALAKQQGLRAVTHVELAANILNSFTEYWQQYLDSGFAALRADLLERIIYLNEMVVLSSPGGDSILGKFIDISDKGQLVVSDYSGRRMLTSDSNYSMRTLASTQARVVSA